ncbi:MAG: Gfo/Idh/MocA family oxidoreductase [Chloroflexota bacterium]|nr:MAG: gfo/Idh/MocA family oxidoreductase [Chloroflexota bacterium]
MLRVGMVGVGVMGTAHLEGWAATPARIVGYVALDEQRAQAMAQKYGGRVYDSLDEMLPDVDVVDICTPTYLHREMTLQAAAAGKHVICEKPLSLTVSGAQEMIDACERAGVHLLVGHVVRFFNEYALAKATVDSGEIGRVAVTRLKRVNFQPRHAADNWFLDPAKSGGMILDLMIHDFDYARWVAGEVESVFARSVRTVDPNAAGDYCLAILRHKNGALTHVEGGWVYPPPMFLTGFEIAGERGLIEHPAGSSVPVGVHLMESQLRDLPAVGVPAAPLAESPYVTEIKHFYDVLTGAIETPRVTARDGLEAVKIGLAVIRSAQTGRSVRIEEVA